MSTKDQDPTLPFAQDGPTLRLVVLKAMFPRGTERDNSFTLSAENVELCVKSTGSWSLTSGREPPRAGNDLLTLASAYLGATPGAVALRLIEAATAINLTAAQRAAIVAAIDGDATSP